MSGQLIRAETEGDHGAVSDVTRRAFETDAEARLVDLLRPVASPLVSLVAEREGRVVGHVMFSPVAVDPSPAEAPLLMGLAPLAVDPDAQGGGVGSALARAGVEACRALGAAAIFVLGHPEYYPRFGFQPAGPLGLHYESERFDSHFFALELEPGALAGVRGFVRYHAAFDVM